MDGSPEEGLFTATGAPLYMEWYKEAPIQLDSPSTSHQCANCGVELQWALVPQDPRFCPWHPRH